MDIPGIDIRMDDGSAESPMEIASSPDSPRSPPSMKPTSQILITNIDPTVFCERHLLEAFERLLSIYDPHCRIFYFRNFLRARVDMDSVERAASAKHDLHGFRFGQRILECYFFRDLLMGRRNSDHLELPPLEKQFLISPPASPPVGWEPVQEGEPIMDLNLIAALAALQPGEIHELHPGVCDKNIPAIVLQPCISHGDVENEERLVAYDSSVDLSDDDLMPSRRVPKPQIVQTRRPTPLEMRGCSNNGYEY